MATQGARNTAVLAAIHTHYYVNGTGHIRPNDYALITFAPILGGALICIVTAILLGVFMIMREKKRKIQEATSLANLPWLDTLEVFTVNDREGAPGMFLPLPGGPTTPSPPPTYDNATKVNEKDQEANEQKSSAYVPPPMREPPSDATPPVLPPPDDLPSYDAAVKLDGNM